MFYHWNAPKLPSYRVDACNFVSTRMCQSLPLIAPFYRDKRQSICFTAYLRNILLFCTFLSTLLPLLFAHHYHVGNMLSILMLRFRHCPLRVVHVHGGVSSLSSSCCLYSCAHFRFRHHRQSAVYIHARVSLLWLNLFTCHQHHWGSVFVRLVRHAFYLHVFSICVVVLLAITEWCTRVHHNFPDIPPHHLGCYYHHGLASSPFSLVHGNLT